MRLLLLTALLAGCGDDAAPPHSANGPVVLATALANPIAIALDSQFIYVANSDDGSVIRLAKNGGSVQTLAVTAAGLRELAVDSQWIYVTNDVAGTMSRIPIAGGNVQTIAMGLDHPKTIVTHAGAAYWINRGSTGGQPGSVMGVLPSGDVVTLATNQSFPASITLDDSNLYWANGREGSIWKIGFAGGEATQLTQQGSPISDVTLVLSDGLIYVVGGNVGLASIPTTGGSLMPGGGPTAGGVFVGAALDNGQMYLLWKSLPLGSGTDVIWVYSPYRMQQQLIPLIADLPSALAVAADETYVYWTESGSSGNGALLRAKR